MTEPEEKPEGEIETEGTPSEPVEKPEDEIETEGAPLEPIVSDGDEPEDALLAELESTAAGGDEPDVGTDDGPADDGPEAEGDVPPDVAGEDERAIRRELGIGGGKIPLDPAEIEGLLRDAHVGYEELFSEAGGEGQPPLAFAGTANPLDDNLLLLRDVHMKVKVELGRGQMYLKDILRLGQGSVVELERLAGDPLDIFVNDKLVARGEVLVLNENFCIRLTEIFNPAEALLQRN